MITKVFISITLAIFFLSCGSLKIYTDYDHDTSIKNYKTFGWDYNKQLEVKNNPLYYNELNDKRIKKEVELQMINKGYEYDATQPNLVMHYHFVLENREVISPDPFSEYGPYWLNRGGSVHDFREGTLIIDFMDPHTNCLVWRGWAVNFLDEEKPDQIGEQLNRAIVKIFAKLSVR